MYGTGCIGNALVSHTPPLSPGWSCVLSLDIDFAPVHVVEALMEEDMERLCTHREAGSCTGFKMHEDRAFAPDHVDMKVLLRLGTGVGLPDVLPLRSCFCDWCNKYFTEPQMRVCDYEFLVTTVSHYTWLPASQKSQAWQHNI